MAEVRQWLTFLEGGRCELCGAVVKTVARFTFDGHVVLFSCWNCMDTDHLGVSRLLARHADRLERSGCTCKQKIRKLREWAEYLPKTEQRFWRFEPCVHTRDLPK